MGKTSKNQKGFSVVEAVLVLIIVALVGVVGYMVYKNHNKTNTPSSRSTTSTKTSTSPLASPYAGWKTYTLPVEKLSFKYPSDWTVDTANSGAPTATQDQVTINASDGFSFNVIDGVSNGGDPIPSPPSAAISVKYLDQSDWLVFSYARDTNGPGFSKTLIGGGGLQTDPNNQYSSPTDQTAVGPNDTDGVVDAKNIAISFSFKSPVMLAQAQSSADLKNVEQIIKSMQY